MRPLRAWVKWGPPWISRERSECAIASPFTANVAFFGADCLRPTLGKGKAAARLYIISFAWKKPKKTQAPAPAEI